MKSKTFIDQINGFTVVPVILNDDKTSPVYHVLYMKKHQTRKNKNDNEDDDNDFMDFSERTVYVVNLPVITTFEQIKSLFQDMAGVIVEHYFPEPGSKGQVVLVDKASCNRLLSKAKQAHKLEKNLMWSKVPENEVLKYYGYSKYLRMADSQIPDPEELLQSVNNFLQAYNDNEEQQKRQRLSKNGFVDEDGFTLVVAPPKPGLMTAAHIAEREAAKQEMYKKEAEKKRKKMENVDFYRFQVRERKKKATNDLLRKFNEDKQKIAEMRQKNRFRPY